MTESPHFQLFLLPSIKVFPVMSFESRESKEVMRRRDWNWWFVARTRTPVWLCHHDFGYAVCSAMLPWLSALWLCHHDLGYVVCVAMTLSPVWLCHQDFVSVICNAVLLGLCHLYGCGFMTLAVLSVSLCSRSYVTCMAISLWLSVSSVWPCHDYGYVTFVMRWPCVVDRILNPVRP